MIGDPLHYPHPSRRNVIYGTDMVCTSHPLASQAGLDILKAGGNAVDAAVAAAACLTVVEPTSCGIGGDAFAILWVEGKLRGLNASGYAPADLIPSVMDGHQRMPFHGWTPVTVPGGPAAWSQLVNAHGEMSLEEVLEPAMEYAEKGHPVAPTVGYHWNRALHILRSLKGPEFVPWFETFAPDGSPPGIGESWRSPGHRRTLELLAETDSQSFYRGELAEAIDSFSRETGGYIRASDLESYEPQWVEPVGVDYRGFDVWEMPPNSQGMVASMALKILNHMEPGEPGSLDTYHRQIESIKMAFQVGREYITDSEYMKTDYHELLQDDFIDDLRMNIGEDARLPSGADPERGGTVYLASADSRGNMVSYIQSNYMGFGSGIVVPGTGISLQNRGASYSLDPSHINFLEPGKRPFHTIIPGFITRGGKPLGPFGVMGGHMQPQGHLQVISNMIDFDMNPQAALDSPRWMWEKENKVLVEPSVPRHVAKGLQRKGHHIRYALEEGYFGRGQIILRSGDSYCAGTEPRADGHIAVQ